MVSMSKEEMITCLKDYANIIYLSTNYHGLSMGKIFDEYMKKNRRYDDCTIEYYDKIRRVATIYSCFKCFSFTEDYLLNQDDFISNNDLNGLNEEAMIFTDATGVTNKRIVQLLRNAFNHNDDSNFDRFKISSNGRFCEIEFNDIRTNREKINNTIIKPFKMKFDLNYLTKVFNKIRQAKQNTLFISFKIPDDFNILSNDLDKELDKIEFMHYHFPRKLSHDVINQMSNLTKVAGLDKEGIYNKSDQLHSFAQEQQHIIREYSLTQDQKDKISSLICCYRKDGTYGIDVLKENYEFFVYYFLTKVIPIPLLKENSYLKQIIISNDYLLDTEISYSDIVRRVYYLCTDHIPDSYDKEDKDMHNRLLEYFDTLSSRERFFMDIKDANFYSMYPMINYIDAVVTQIYSDDIIVINKKEYKTKELRNCFVHGRWYISKYNELVMLDAYPNNINDYDLRYIGKIEIDEFIAWADEYMDNIQKKQRLLR